VVTESDPTEALAQRGDLDGLLRLLDDLCDRGDWDEVLRLRRLSRAAIERGHQLWPAATHAEYRLALDAPGPWCAQVLDPDAGLFAFGPLTEVAASTHTWDELEPHLEAGPGCEQFALERVVRGEDLTGQGLEAGFHTDLPLRLMPWEPTYPLATYTADEVTAPAPDRPVGEPAATTVPAGDALDDPDGVSALRAVVAHWVERSNGRSEALAVAGDHRHALAALGVPRPRVAEVSGATALAHVAWAAGSGGAHGRRRGMAAARFEVWWLVTALAGLSDDWPVDPDELGEVVDELRWFLWDASEPETGWTLQLCVEDPADGLAWILSARDA
jgi:hypothetical protein